MNKFENLKAHPIADILPMLEAGDAASLRADIAANGLIEEIVLLEGKILDGRNRYSALVDLDWHRQERFYVTFDHVAKVAGTKITPLDFVIAKNIERRHLNESQRAMAAAKTATMKQGERTDIAAVEPAGPLDNAPPSANLPKVDATVSQGDAAKRFNVSVKSVGSAARVESSGTPELQSLVEKGQVAVSVAAEIAALPAEEQDRIIADTAPAQLKTKAKQIKRNARQKTLAGKQMALPAKKYGVIYADCEHLFKTRSEAGNDRGAVNHYDVSTLAELQARRVVDIAADDCALFFWVPVPNLIEGICIAQAWGFLELVKDDQTGFLKPIKKFSRYVSQWSWLKEKITTGFWSRGKHEMLLIFTRGRPVAPAEGQQPPSWLEAAETLSMQGKHSEKPDLFADAIAALFPDTPKIELNARKARAGWDVWGKEAPVPGAGDEAPAKTPRKGKPKRGHGAEHDARSKARDVHLNQIAADFPDDITKLSRLYENARDLFDSEIRHGNADLANAQAEIMDAILCKANGGTEFGVAVVKTTEKIVKHVDRLAAKKKSKPAFGRVSVITRTVDGMTAICRLHRTHDLQQDVELYAAENDKLFVSETGFHSVMGMEIVGKTPEQVADAAIEWATQYATDRKINKFAKGFVAPSARHVIDASAMPHKVVLAGDAPQEQQPRKSIAEMACQQEPATAIKPMAVYKGKHTADTDAVIVKADEDGKSLIEVCALLGLGADQVRVVKRRRAKLGLTSVDNIAKANKARAAGAKAKTPAK